MRLTAIVFNIIMNTGSYDILPCAIDCADTTSNDGQMKRNPFQLSLFDRNQNDIRVENSDGSISRVKQGSRCSCGSNQSCEHFRQARLYLDMDRGLFYDGKSGFHKSIRLAEVERSLAYARILDRYKKGTARSYLRGIWAEETRNLDLLARFYDGTPTEELIELFCRSCKDWQCPEDVGIFSRRWLEIHLRFGCNPSADWEVSYPWPNEENIKLTIAQMIEADDFDSLLEMVVCATSFGPTSTRYRKAVRFALVEEVMKRAKLLNVPPVVEKLKATSYHSEELVALWRILAGKRNSGDDEYCNKPVQGREQMDVPFVEDYVFDMHTREGKRRLRKAGHLLAWEKPMAAGIDLRYSGAEAGTLWRYLAWEQHGRIDVPWEAVKLDEELSLVWKSLIGGRLTT